MRLAIEYANNLRFSWTKLGNVPDDLATSARYISIAPVQDAISRVNCTTVLLDGVFLPSAKPIQLRGEANRSVSRKDNKTRLSPHYLRFFLLFFLIGSNEILYFLFHVSLPFETNSTIVMVFFSVSIFYLFSYATADYL